MASTPISARSISGSAAISPYTGQIYLNGHEFAEQRCRKEGIAFTALDNAFGTAGAPAAVQRICDGLTGQKIYRFAGKWLARLPQPFTRADEDAGYRWQLPDGQIEFSTTMALDRPVSGADLLRAADPRQPRASAARTRSTSSSAG